MATDPQITAERHLHGAIRFFFFLVLCYCVENVQHPSTNVFQASDCLKCRKCIHYTARLDTCPVIMLFFIIFFIIL